MRVCDADAREVVLDRKNREKKPLRTDPFATVTLNPEDKGFGFWSAVSFRGEKKFCCSRYREDALMMALKYCREALLLSDELIQIGGVPLSLLDS